MFMAHTESKHRVKFAREQVVAAFNVAGTVVAKIAKNIIFLFISLCA